MNKEMIGGVVRHIITAAGTGLMTEGVLTSDDTTAIAGGIAAILSVIWSLYQKKKSVK